MVVIGSLSNILLLLIMSAMFFDVCMHDLRIRFAVYKYPLIRSRLDPTYNWYMIMPLSYKAEDFTLL